MRIIIIILAFVVFFAGIAPAFAQSEAIGTIVEIEGTATVTTQGQRFAAAADMPVHLKDTVETGSSSRVMILFIDDTQMILSSDTKLAIDQYVYDPGDKTNNKGVYSVLKGVFFYVSGLIAKKENPDVTVNTQAGAIGIRGTQFWGGEIDGEYGVLVDEGEVSLKTDAGEQTVKQGQGTTVAGRAFRPSAPKIWGADKAARARQTVYLKRQELIRERLQALKARHADLREKRRKLREERQDKLQEQHPAPQPGKRLQNYRQKHQNYNR